MAQLTQKNVELQRAAEAERAAWLQEKKTLEGTIWDLTSSERNSETNRVSHEDEVRQLNERDVLFLHVFSAFFPSCIVVAFSN